MLQEFHKLHSKPKTILECIAADPGWLDTDNDQYIIDVVDELYATENILTELWLLFQKL